MHGNIIISDDCRLHFNHNIKTRSMNKSAVIDFDPVNVFFFFFMFLIRQSVDWFSDDIFLQFFVQDPFRVAYMIHFVRWLLSWFSCSRLPFSYRRVT